MKEKHTYSHADVHAALPEALRVSPFSIPTGYFEGFRDRVIRKCWPEASTDVEFGVPEGYFEQLADRINGRIAEEQLKVRVSDTGFTVPPNYFDALRARTQGTVTHAGFAVPTGYFDALPDRILQKTVHKPATPVRKMRRTKWISYGAAACIAIAAGVVGVLNLNKDQATTPPADQLAAVPDQEILNYLELYGAPNEVMFIADEAEDLGERDVVEELSDEEIEAYLNHTL